MSKQGETNMGGCERNNNNNNNTLRFISIFYISGSSYAKIQSIRRL